MLKPNFAKLWASYPTENHPCDGGYANQCAIRMSLTLNTEGTVRIDRTTYPEPRCSHGHARGAESLANHLRKQLGPPTIHRKGAAAKRALAGKTGIIFFKDCFVREGETAARGDHIDLWKLGVTKTYDDPANNAKQVWFWKLA